MKVLIFGPSGSGKTYVAKALQHAGINAFDDADIDGLSSWYDQSGQKVPEPATAGEAAERRLAFLWSKKALKRFIDQFDDIYVFGGSGNVWSVFELFDRVYFLDINPELQKQRLMSPDRPTPLMDIDDDDGFVIWGAWFKQMAKEKGIPFINADQTPEQIFQIISQP
ncbi:hypothetical protein ACFS5N_08540 [Mucilaginibacter ximonensis]|uniref:Adenylate kinase n=1 Tax=Mucilaginibacter ximonensis TaxID=538021 RepID=A0ABW5YB82_9SPHI